MKEETSKQVNEQFFAQLLRMPDVNNVWHENRGKAKNYYRQHLGDFSQAVVKEKIRWICKTERTRIPDVEQVAEKLIKIKNIGERIKQGDEGLVLEVAKAFAKHDSNSVTWPQFQNALHFLALHAPPDKFVEINPFVKGLLETIGSGTMHFKGALTSIPFDKVYDVLLCIKALYEAIKEVSNCSDVSYCTIYEKLVDFALLASVVLTNPEVVTTGAQVLIDIGETMLNTSGIIIPPGLLSNDIQRHLGKVVGESLSPYLQKIHEIILQKLKSYRINHQNLQQ